jgi:hypothetical protein
VTVQQQGREWEQEFANEFGLTLVPGSGSPWWSGKLDVSGAGARWSLKWTSKDSYRFTAHDLNEALEATGSLSGTSEIPLWALNIQGRELVIMRKEDFKQMQVGELNVLPEKRTKTAERTRLSEIPILLREQDENDEGFS